LNQQISTGNATHFGAFLPWLSKTTLVRLGKLALKGHVFYACINGVLQLSFKLLSIAFFR
jgi:hypothetical protein